MSQDQSIAELHREMLTDGSWRQMERYAMTLARVGRDKLAKLLMKEKSAPYFRTDPIRQKRVDHRPRNFQGSWEVRDFQMWPGEIIHGHPVFRSYMRNAVHSIGPDGVFVGFACENRICLEGHEISIRVRTPAGVDAEVESYFWPILEQGDEGQQVVINSPLTMRLRRPTMPKTIGTVANVLTERQAWVRVWEPEDGRDDNDD